MSRGSLADLVTELTNCDLAIDEDSGEVSGKWVPDELIQKFENLLSQPTIEIPSEELRELRKEVAKYYRLCDAL